jgi:Cu(I)/Ag(I) efflux system membrane fusion protein
MTKRNNIFIAIIIVLAVLAVAAYATKGLWLPHLPFGHEGPAAETAQQCKEVYVCPMHPQIVKERPGDCPICGMSLVKKELSEGDSKDQAKGGGVEVIPAEGGLQRVTLDPRQRMLANVATTMVMQKSISQDINTVGKIAVNEQNLRKVTARYGGRIELLAVNFTGQPVRKGQLVMSIYSPELLSTQKEYLIAKQSSARLKNSDFPEIAKGSDGVLDAARTRMKLWGVTDAQINALDKTGEARPVIDIYSPVSGTIMDIKMRQGDYVMEGSEVYTVADLSRVWMLADVYEYEFSKVSLGSEVEVTADAFPGRVFRGRVAFIDPSVNPESRTVKVRVDLPNPSGVLKPEMFVNARIFSKAQRGLTIPASAVMYTGNRNVAWVEVEPNIFEPRDLKLGLRSGDEYIVFAGLKEGESVVSQGGFLIDSEAQLRASASGAMPGMDMGGGKTPAVEKTPTVESGKAKDDMKNMPGM